MRQPTARQLFRTSIPVLMLLLTTLLAACMGMMPANSQYALLGAGGTPSVSINSKSKLTFTVRTNNPNTKASVVLVDQDYQFIGGQAVQQGQTISMYFSGTSSDGKKTYALVYLKSYTGPVIYTIQAHGTIDPARQGDVLFSRDNQGWALSAQADDGTDPPTCAIDIINEKASGEQVKEVQGQVSCHKLASWLPNVRDVSIEGKFNVFMSIQ